MSQQVNQDSKPGTFLQVMRTFQLVWRLMNDPRVPILPKLIVPAVLVYVVSPIDLIPDMIPVLGQLDDIGVIFFGIRFFIENCPPEIVIEHRRAIARRGTAGGGEYVDATYRVVDDEERN